MWLKRWKPTLWPAGILKLGIFMWRTCWVIYIIPVVIFPVRRKNCWSRPSWLRVPCLSAKDWLLSISRLPMHILIMIWRRAFIGLTWRWRRRGSLKVRGTITGLWLMPMPSRQLWGSNKETMMHSTSVSVWWRMLKEQVRYPLATSLHPMPVFTRPWLTAIRKRLWPRQTRYRTWRNSIS